MYTKTYGVPERTVSVTLGLSTLGTINMITVNNDGNIQVLSTSLPTPQKTAIVASWQNFADGMYISVNEMQPNSRYFDHFDVQINDQGLPAAVNPGGFCPTGVMSEAAYKVDKGCTPSDMYVFQRLYGVSSSNSNSVANAKLRFCQNWFTDWQSCRSKPWYYTLCLRLVQQPMSYISNAANYPADFMTCVNEFEDSPAQVIAAYKTGEYHNQTAPLNCSPFTFNPSTPAQTGQYAYIEMANNRGSWDAMYSFGEMDVACGASFALSGNTPSLMHPGTYRVLQCQTSPVTPTCMRYKQFTVRVQYNGVPVTGPLVSELSTPLGQLEKNSYLGCTIPNCPTSLPPNSEQYYRCCMWTLFSIGWQQCMLSAQMIMYDRAYFDANFPYCSH